MSDLLRVYFDPAEIGPDGYPHAWHGPTQLPPEQQTGLPQDGPLYEPAIKDLIRERDGHRCLRCGHPYRKGEHGNGEWSPCDDRCDHGGPFRPDENSEVDYLGPDPNDITGEKWGPIGREAKWRILTVHHLNGVKHDCRWWNLVSLCQRCHLSIQSRVVLDRVYPFEHSDWFKPFAAGWYAWAYLGEELTREQVDGRIEELLALERQA